MSPFIVTSSHSWPMVNLLDQAQLGMLCVQVKSCPSWSTSVTTLWSVMALRRPVRAQGKFQMLKITYMTINLFMNDVSWKTISYQGLLETPHSFLDSLTRISQRMPWWWKDRDEVRKEFMRQKGVACNGYTVWSFAIPTSSLIYFTASAPQVCVNSWGSFLFWLPVFQNFASLSMYVAIKCSEQNWLSTSFLNRGMFWALLVSLIRDQQFLTTIGLYENESL